jgi:vacuolar-type H+-ATPase subunit E/Vma4
MLKLGEGFLNSSGGFILRYGDLEINCTLEIIVKHARPNMEAEVAKILFNE